MVNNKPYIGQTWRKLKKRFGEHLSSAARVERGCVKLNNAIRKHNSNNFNVQIIACCGSQEIADYLESFFIEEYDSIKNGYNIRTGGSSLKGSDNPMYGKHHSIETKKIISMKNKGKPSLFKGRVHTQEAKDINRKKHLGIYDGEKNPSAKLTLIQVNEIKSLFKENKYTRQEIADKFNISLSTIKRIKAGTHWK